MTIKLNAATGGGSVSLSAPNSTTSNLDVELTLPVDDGAANTFLKSDGSGTLSWAAASSDNITEGNTTVECVDTGSNGHITFDTEGSEAARFDSSQRLLVGTTSTSVASTAIFQGLSSSASFEPFVFLARGSTPDSNSPLGIIKFSDNTHSSAAEIKVARNGGTWTSGSSQPTKFEFNTTADGASSPTTRLRIFADGLIDVFNSAGFLPANDNVTSLGRSGQRWTAVWAANGTIQTSDERAKTNIAESSLGSDFIKSLRPVSYKWIDGGKVDTGERDEENSWVLESVPGQRTHWGFIAQEVKEAVDAAGVDFGGWVLTDKDDPDSEQALRYDQFIAPLTKALQEALAKIETLETANASLEARLTALEGGAS